MRIMSEGKFQETVEMLEKQLEAKKYKTAEDRLRFLICYVTFSAGTENEYSYTASQLDQIFKLAYKEKAPEERQLNQEQG
ncbi:MAG: hypothetical protein ACLRPV_01435 [Lacrimispora saccharolytica]